MYILQKLVDMGAVDYLASTKDQFCPANVMNTILSKRSIEDDAKSSWDKCMDKKVCKIVAIVLIVIAALFAFWLVSTLIQVLCCGVKCVGALFCCFRPCCPCGDRNSRDNSEEKHYQYQQNGNRGYYNQPQPMYHQQSNANPFETNLPPRYH
ncbi:hypothetical protein BVG19_g2667 [[Candida] boidinii]|nr:hypothetical protein BVG19_g2667 [[Candida] boidinii]OWB51828.1 hypothetical protein B5S27_g3398 [[Candida] boidinii]